MIQKQMLEYQKIDGELNRIERDLRKSEAYQNIKKYKALRQDYEDTLNRFDAKANELKTKLTQAKQTVAKITTVIQELSNEMSHVESSDELKYMSKKLDEQLKLLSATEGEIKDILREGEEIAKKFDEINSKLVAIAKALKTANDDFANQKEAVKPRVMELKSKLDALKPQLDQKLFEMYERISAGKVFPVFVPLSDGNRCGGCRMDMPLGVVETEMQRHGGIMRCEHCGRIMYTAD